MTGLMMMDDDDDDDGDNFRCGGWRWSGPQEIDLSHVVMMPLSSYGEGKEEEEEEEEELGVEAGC